MFELVESIRKKWLLQWGFPVDSPRTATCFYRNHIGAGHNCGCDLYFELLDAVPLRMPTPPQSEGTP